MPTLSDYTNVFGTALQVLKEKGYQVWFDEAMDAYRAERDGWDFASPSPCGLLGMVAIYEHRKPTQYEEYWWRKDQVDPNDLPREPVPFKTVLATQRRSARDPRRPA